MAKLFANIGDPDQMPHFAAPDLGLQGLPIALLGVSRLKWYKHRTNIKAMKWVDFLSFSIRVLKQINGNFPTTRFHLRQLS